MNVIRLTFLSCSLVLLGACTDAAPDELVDAAQGANDTGTSTPVSQFGDASPGLDSGAQAGPGGNTTGPTSPGDAGGAAPDAGSTGSTGHDAGKPDAGALADAGASCGVPTSFKWSSSKPLISPRSGTVSIKDPSVVFFEDKWHVFATEYTNAWSMVYLNFADWNQADSATKTSAATNPRLTGYKCAPTMFYFSPQKLWYVIYQTQTPAYSTSTNPSDIQSWSAKKDFWSSQPGLITNSSTGGIDYWPICDDLNCYIFYAADNGELYRAQTSKASFPNGFGNHTKILGSTADKFALFEAPNVYKMKGTGKYLLLVEAIGDGRYFRSWTADKLDGDWSALAATQANPFAGKGNVSGADWSNDGISHGEMLRTGYDESMEIDTCKLQFLFQGRTAAGATYDQNAYSLGLLTAVKN